MHEIILNEKIAVLNNSFSDYLDRIINTLKK